MKLVKLAVIFFLLFSTALFAHQSVSTKTQNAIVNTSDRMSGSSKTEKHSLLLVAGAKVHSLQKDIRLQSGQMRVRLYSPDSKLFSEMVYTSDTRDNIKQTLPLTKGKWRMEIEARNATGKYDVEWKTSTY